MSEEDTCDKELLTLAAKAVDIDLLAEEWEDGFIYYYYKIPGDTQGWNPLNCDSDALRLAVKLGLEVRTDGPYLIAVTPRYVDNELYEPRGEDPCAATRRAIVRAAAEIGKVKCFL